MRKRRAPEGHTAERCPVCKFESNQQEKDERGRDKGVRFTFREKDSPCNDCKEQMRLDAQELHMYRMRDEGRKSGEGDREYWVSGHPYIEHREFQDGLGSALTKVAKLLGIKMEVRVEWEAPKLFFLRNHGGLAADYPWFYSKEEAEALQGLYDAINVHSEHVYQNGKSRGLNLLENLRSGEMGLSEFEEQRRSRH
jgi:hypothetical protein